MENLRRYGRGPFTIAVVHGGPGAAGEMAPVARELSSSGMSVLEPIQTATTLDGQVEELREALVTYCSLPAMVVGFSWGAWLGYLIAARYPGIIGQLILVGSGPFEEKYVERIQQTRLSRLNASERTELTGLLERLSSPSTVEPDSLLARLGELTFSTDTYDPLTDEEAPGEEIITSGELFRSVWKEAAEFRRSGCLLEEGAHISCPVVGLHGDYDPHPAEGVREPLSAVLKEFELILLDSCGHKPWIERQARERFYELLREKLTFQKDK